MMFSLVYLKDLIEILFFSAIIYYFCTWLKKDSRHNLLGYFFGYYATLCCSYFLNFAGITIFLLYSLPIALVLFIIFHQELIQRNFVTLRKAPLVIQPNEQWCQELIRSMLYAINNNKDILCVIEHLHDLKPFLSSCMLFNGPILQNTLELIIESPYFDAQKIVWCSSQGTLIAVNSDLNSVPDQSWYSESAKTAQGWQQDALIITLKTDAIAIQTNASKRCFDAIIKGTLHENVSAPALVQLIMNHVGKTIQKGDYNAIGQKAHQQQLHT